MPRALLLLAALTCTLALAQEPLVLEAEDVSSPATAILADQNPTDHWNLWSKDPNAAAWSGGKVLQSPRVEADREKPEDGAPPLQVALRDIPPGAYRVTLKFGRGLAFALDGKQYRRLSETAGIVGTLEPKDGLITFWVDDLFADPTSPGWCYFDTVTLTPALPQQSGVTNGGFESGATVSIGWTWWSRENTGAAGLTEDAHSGKRAVKITHDGTKDFAFTNHTRLDVQPGQDWTATAWAKCEPGSSVELAVVAYGKGQLITWSLGADSADAPEWASLAAPFRVPEGCDQVFVRFVGSGKTAAWVDDVAMQPGKLVRERKPKPLVQGFATQRIEEPLNRGMVAMPTPDGKVYLGWRLLQTDAASVSFNVYRATGRMRPVKLTETPITRTTDFVDAQPPLDRDNAWWVRPVVDGQELDPSDQAFLPRSPEPKPYLAIKLQGDHDFQKAGIGDLDGDGAYDFVLKQPADNIDPYEEYWTKSPDTYKLEAYNHSGQFMWRHDLGWPIERGIWYSPYVVYDFDGDGKAEVATKTGEGDPRDADGRVNAGPEWCSILDGESGAEVTRVDWPSRDGMGGYNTASRNQIGVAFLDGKTPCLLVARGTYSLMKLVAYQYRDRKLTELWRWDSKEEGAAYRGQGAHWMHSADVDADGREEVILGSSVIDDNGVGLWSTGLGHPDKCFVTDVDPARPGLEIFYNIEPGHPQSGVLLADARNGEIIWGLKEQSYHVGSGMTADVDPTQPGCECWAAEDPKGGAQTKWLFSATGEVLARDSGVPGWTCVYWDADPLRELAGGSITKFKGPTLQTGIEGNHVAWADILGDWREEIITSVKGELRIYTTTIPATDRRVCLMQDPVYRHDVAHLAMGYAQPPVTSYYIGQTGPVLGLLPSAARLSPGEPLACKLTLLAPATESASGTVRLAAAEGVTIVPSELPLAADPGQLAQAELTVTVAASPSVLDPLQAITLTATLDSAAPVQATMVLPVEPTLPPGSTLLPAEDFTSQAGGEVHLRDDKVGALGKCFSHWDARGHSLTWAFTVAAPGNYFLALRCCTPTGALRDVDLDDSPLPFLTIPPTGGFAGDADDWRYIPLTADGKPLPLHLTPGTHTLKLTNADAQGLNLDALVLVPAP